MIIISGASGLIGTSLTNLLKKKRLKLKTIKTKQILIKKEAFFKKASHFIHLGFNFYKKEKYKNDINIRYLKKILYFSKKYRFKIIFPSTSTYKYNFKKKIISNKIFSYNNYTKSKIKCEKLLSQFYKKNKLPVIILRIFNVYGNNQKKGWLIPDTINKFLDKRNKQIYVNHCYNTRDFIHVQDVSSAIYKSLNIKGLQYLNIGSGKETSIIKVIKIIKKGLKSKKKIICLSKKSIINSVSKANIYKSKKILKWKPKINLVNELIKISKYENKKRN